MSAMQSDTIAACLLGTLAGFTVLLYYKLNLVLIDFARVVSVVIDIHRRSRRILAKVADYALRADMCDLRKQRSAGGMYLVGKLFKGSYVAVIIHAGRRTSVKISKVNSDCVHFKDADAAFCSFNIMLLEFFADGTVHGLNGQGHRRHHNAVSESTIAYLDRCEYFCILHIFHNWVIPFLFDVLLLLLKTPLNLSCLYTNEKPFAIACKKIVTLFTFCQVSTPSPIITKAHISALCLLSNMHKMNYNICRLSYDISNFIGVMRFAAV